MSTISGSVPCYVHKVPVLGMQDKLYVYIYMEIYIENSYIQYIEIYSLYDYITWK